jgi:hypothetical protein
MRYPLLYHLLILAVISCAVADDIVLFDDFEGGLGLWETNGWGVSETWSISPTHSMTESPSGNYPTNITLLASTVAGADLSNYLGARLEFWASYEIEPAFDYCKVEVTRDDVTWIPLGSLSGLNLFWQLMTYDLGGFAGQSSVRVRFRFYSDPMTTYDGIYIDDFSVIGTDQDTSGPLILHPAPSAYEGSPDDVTVYADLLDASGISDDHLFYRLDGRPFQEAPRINQIGERYYYTIPAQEAGTLVEYYFEATDASPEYYTSVSDTFAYLAGVMLIQDDGLSEAIFEALPGNRAAVKFSPIHSIGYVASALVRIYTDSSIPLDSINVYVWGDQGGLPGSVLAGPFEVYPASGPQEPEAWTRVDLRSALLETPDVFHVGCEFSVTGSAQTMALSYDQPPVYRLSSADVGNGFEPVTFGDFHIRAVIGDLTPDQLLPPSDLIGQGLGELVVLSWSAPSGTDDLLRYEIQRQDEIVGQTIYLETEYTDTLTGLPWGTYVYRVRARYSTGVSPFSDPWTYQWDSTAVLPHDPPSPPQTGHLEIFPNPANGQFSVHYSLPPTTNANNTLSVFNICGQRILHRKLPEGVFEGAVEFELKGNLSAGIYLVELRVGKSSGRREKLVYLK